MSDEPEDGTAAVSPFADARGGPAVYSGIGYQTAWATSRALAEVLSALTQPSRSSVLRLEPRVLVGGGQAGFDVGIDRDGHRSRHEAKMRPSKSDVVDLLARLPALAHEDDLEVVLVAGAGGVWFDAVDALAAYAREATDEAEFASLLVASREPRRIGLAELMGDQPWAAARRLGIPLLMPSAALDDQVRRAAVTLAGAPRADELSAWCARRLEDGARHREALSVQSLAGEMEARHLLMPVMAVPTADDMVVRAIAVLETCGRPLPSAVLAEALGMSEAALLEALDGHVTSGSVTSVNETLSRPLARILVPARYAGDAVERTLDGLVRLARREPAAGVGQAYNAYLLSRVVQASRPDLVAEVFYAYDKAVKGTGSLLLVQALAQKAMAAIALLAERVDTVDQGRLLWLRGHARICGTTWCYQRVGQHERAAEEMDSARAEAVRHGHADNVAYADKCQGRISRLRAEDLAATGDHAAAAVLFEESVTQLLRAHEEFEALILGGDTGRADEPGECLSLAARTLMSAGDLDAAKAASGRAREALAGLALPSKAAADQALLDVEMELALAAEGQPVGGAALRRLADVCEAVVTDFTTDRPLRPEAGVNVGESEIRARAQRQLGGLLLRLGDRESGATAFEAAATEFRAVDSVAVAYECSLLALEARGSIEPRLLAVLDERGSSVAARVEAHRLFTAQGGAGRTDTFVRGLVTNAEELALLRQHPFGETAA